MRVKLALNVGNRPECSALFAQPAVLFKSKQFPMTDLHLLQGSDKKQSSSPTG